MRNRGIKLPSNLEKNTAFIFEGYSGDIKMGDFFDTFQYFMSVKELESLAKSTLEDHRNFMRYFKNYVEDVHGTGAVPFVLNIDVLRSYLYHMVNEKGLKNIMVNIRLRYMKVYLNWLYEEGRIKDNLSKR
ncbi:phage integrase SAM-like domain-containing protein [uncultured Ilyobacter sp.]|uniref:phage integrase SAM-like domain-containing protein n=1 Tax=uncultured Ilyobacter sp. TaxID=544433 RepID=UPI0029C61F92|nr:phage integrase SAM-like domain-containing protein [uncultured Ilyobacter sp.]